MPRWEVIQEISKKSLKKPLAVRNTAALHLWYLQFDSPARVCFLCGSSAIDLKLTQSSRKAGRLGSKSGT